MGSKKSAAKPESAADIDFSRLMDLRVDYAFKLFFGKGGKHRLRSLLNAIFENRQIPRVVAKLTIENPSLEKNAEDDKLSILDIRAKLKDGTSICIEMHLYDLTALKYKSVRSWARVYGEDLKPGQEYPEQNTVICISFVKDAITDGKGDPIGKLHSLFQIMERDGHEVLLPDMELHFINMKEFVRQCKEMDGSAAGCDMFTKWLTLITQHEIADKDKVRRICSEGEMQEALDALATLSEDKIKRQAYQRRMDQLYFHEKAMKEKDAALAVKDAVIADKDAVIADRDAALADRDAALAVKDAVIADNETALADRDAALADKDAALADRDALIAELQAKLAGTP